MRRTRPLLLLAACAVLTACGGETTLLRRSTTTTVSSAKTVVPQIGFPALATKNTTRVPGSNPVADAAAVALAVYPSAGAGSHPPAVVLAPTGDWEAAIASSVLMAPPIKAPLLLSGSSSLPSISATALHALAPGGSGAAGGAQVIRVGPVPKLSGGVRTASVSATGPFALAAAIDKFATAAAGRASPDVVIASADAPQYAMPAAGWAAESGDPVLFVSTSGVPAETRQALLSHQSPHIYVLGPASVIPNSVVAQLAKLGTVKRVGASDPGANSVAFTIYRDPPCPFGQPCAHVPGSFGWALRSPGHGYVLLNAARTLDAAAAAPLSASGSYGPQLLLDDAGALPRSVLNYFLDFATPGFTAEGPTAAVYNHAWMIGDQHAVSLSVQSEVDTLLEAVPQK
ncbi:MAG TPA: cell wall-binding repeat-containing protein [Solirubrobacteraceae bacterium]|nr:cell wall-binding repeat-containing protein [Solirubrobacteraceae bacterium]